MQTQDPAKRRLILASAARLFAEQPFHDVTLEQVATAARVGKGTLYVYFASKDQLYTAAVAEGLSDLAGTIDERLRVTPADAPVRLSAIVEELLGFSRRYPHLFALMRSGHPIAGSGELDAARRRVASRIEVVLRDGVERGQIDDPRPDLTAQFALAMVRASLLYGPVDAPHADLAAQILRVLLRGVAAAPN
ncbi:MAG: TetR/AcrR family transcriptional regulator [Planctomycetes bacterium]|nr:TetR/AcrR family transcriptional regulator [Planctomycetota bacterium]